MTSETRIEIKLTNQSSVPFNLPEDKYTNDSLLKQKLRSINLIRHNPNIFTNREGAFELLGGYRSLATTLTFGGLAVLYRIQANRLRGIKYRMGMRNNYNFFLFGSMIGALYSTLFFVDFQVLMNDYFAQSLFKRYPDSAKLSRNNIWLLRNKENDDECYYFTNSYMNTYHC